jgi:hypothetical protein
MRNKPEYCAIDPGGVWDFLHGVPVWFQNFCMADASLV